MGSTKWKKRQDVGDREAGVVQKEPPGADPGPGNVLGEDDAVDPAAWNADVPAAGEDANAPPPEDGGGENVPQAQPKRNRHFRHSIQWKLEELEFRIHIIINYFLIKIQQVSASSVK